MDTLKQAKALADEILMLTQNLVLTGKKENAEAEAEAYSELMFERELLVEEMTDLRQQIDEEESASAQFAEIKEVIEKIVAMDKKNLAIMEKLSKIVKTSYKGVKQGQRIHAGYNPLQGDEAPSRFDMKQ